MVNPAMTDTGLEITIHSAWNTVVEDPKPMIPGKGSISPGHQPQKLELKIKPSGRVSGLACIYFFSLFRFFVSSSFLGVFFGFGWFVRKFSTQNQNPNNGSSKQKTSKSQETGIASSRETKHQKNKSPGESHNSLELVGFFLYFCFGMVFP